MKRLKRIVLLWILFTLILSLPWISDPLHDVTRHVEHRLQPPRLEPTRQGGLDDAAFAVACHYLNTHRRLFKNTRYLSVIDYTKPSYSKRMYVVDLRNGTVEKHLVAHGKNSGSVYARDFSNEMDSFKSCKGFFRTGKKYEGTHGTALVLHGLERGVNDNAFQRRIVMHGAEYVSSESIRRNRGRLGLSWGCPVVPLREIDPIVDKIEGGSLLYIHAN